jgi:two-component system chemotaxis response regulator CheY
MRSILRRIVTDLGFETLEAADGQRRWTTNEADPDALSPDRLETGDGRLHLHHQRPGQPGLARHHLMMVTESSTARRRALAAGAHEYGSLFTRTRSRTSSSCSSGRPAGAA